MPKVRCVCNRLFSFKAEHAGKVVTCPVCKAKIRLPAEKATEPAAPPAQAAAAPPQAKKLELDTSLPAGVKPPPDVYALDKPVPAPQPQLQESVPAPAPPSDVSSTASDDARNFWKQFGRAFVYPLSAGGLAALAIAFVVFVAGHYAIVLSSKVDMIRDTAERVVYLILVGSMTKYIMAVMKSSAEGDDKAPSWPNLAEFRDNVFMPVVLILFPAAFTIGPAIVYYYLASSVNGAILMAIIAAGLTYLPMSMLPLALENNFTRLNPLPVLRAIALVPMKYASVWALAVLTAAAWLFGGRLLSRALPLPVLPVIIQQAVFVYLAFIVSRLIGLLCYTAEDSLKIPTE